MLSYICNQSTWEMETGLPGWGQLGLYSKTLSQNKKANKYNSVDYITEYVL